MSRDDSADARGLSRRELLMRTVRFGAGAVVPVDALRRPMQDDPALAAAPTQVAVRSTPENLTTAEAATLDAIAARLIPTDENGPGATEARATRYIDRALGGALARSREAYRSGLAEVDARARASKGAPFAQLPTADQDAILTEMESTAFFNIVRTHAIQGTFGDPYYGGNANFAGWDLIRYPGVRLAASADDQRMDPLPARVRRSAYDHAMFAKRRPARARLGPIDEPWRSS